MRGGCKKEGQGAIEDRHTVGKISKEKLTNNRPAQGHAVYKCLTPCKDGIWPVYIGQRR